MKTLKVFFFFNQAFACMHLNVQICVQATFSSIIEPKKQKHKLKPQLCITVLADRLNYSLKLTQAVLLLGFEE